MALPIDAETRGRLRQWKSELGRRYSKLDRMLETKSLDTEAISFARRGSRTGRLRAFDRLQCLLAPAGAVLEGLRLDGRAPLAVWSILNPRSAVAIESNNPERMQECVTVNYLLAGRLPGIHTLAEGFWSLEVPDHALGRLLSRSTANPDSVVLAAHHALLRLDREQALPNDVLDPSRQFLLPAGPGVFVCSLRAGQDPSLNYQWVMHGFAHTWLADDMLHGDQAPVLDDGGPDKRLGDYWLLPAPVRRLWEDNNIIRGVGWAPGLPDTLAEPQGHA